MPSGAGRSGRTKPGSIKGLFRVAGKAATQRDPDAPKPQARKRRGDGSDTRVPLHQLKFFKLRDKNAARGRYARLAVPLQTPNEFTRAANFLCSAAQGIAGIFADLNEQLAHVLYGHTGLYLSDTLDWLNLWQDNANNEQGLDDNFSAPQVHYLPHL